MRQPRGVSEGTQIGVATARERGRLGLDLVGAEAISPSTFDVDLERVVRFRLGFAATSPSRLAAADSAVAGPGGRLCPGFPTQPKLLCQRRSML
jgi:hypothetical protein